MHAHTVECNKLHIWKMDYYYKQERLEEKTRLTSICMRTVDVYIINIIPDQLLLSRRRNKRGQKVVDKWHPTS